MVTGQCLRAATISARSKFACRIIHYNYPHVDVSSPPLANSTSHSGAFNSRRSFGTWIICYTQRGRNYVASINHEVQSRATRLQRIFYNLLSYVGRSHLFRPTIMTNQRRRILRVIAPAGCESQFSRRINLRPHRAKTANRNRTAVFSLPASRCMRTHAWMHVSCSPGTGCRNFISSYLTRSSCNHHYLVTDCKSNWQVTTSYDDLRQQYLYLDAYRLTFLKRVTTWASNRLN